ncbi:MAG: metalloregulator ArsR/SmtB family transcription factor [Aigarchaeota archaeon]|nr:metalloregulator ArsR/SmtB family transcription factor [Aigarchaeota archaeon]MCS7127379.1 metalloregulator ArsR/SmtB family transcription factor [Candidatus Calditenuaceae archaeon]MDW8042832.1 metalloregulator ArsR/SmtB family transcription factor [Nitrososphaerota archaeon]
MAGPEGSCDQVAEFLAALSHPKRLRILSVLREGPRAVTELARAVGLSQSATSQHLQVLRGLGIVGVTRTGNMSYYSIADLRVLQLCRLAQEIVSERAKLISEAVSAVRFEP